MSRHRLKSPEAAAELTKDPPQWEDLVSVIEAALSAIPIGSVFASLMKDYIPRSREERLVAFAQSVADDVKEIAGQIDADYVRTDQFAYLFEQCFRRVAEHYQAEKVQAYRALIKNALTHPEISAQNKEFYLQLIDSIMSPGIHLLGAVAQGSTSKESAWSTNGLKFQHLTAQEVGNVAENLASLGLLEVSPPETNLAVPVPSTSITDLGSSLVRFVTSGESLRSSDGSVVWMETVNAWARPEMLVVYGEEGLPALIVPSTGPPRT